MGAQCTASGDLLSRSDTSLSAASSFSLVGRVRKTASSDNGMVEIFFNSGAWVAAFTTFGDQIFMFLNDGTTDFGTNFTYTTNTWYHLALTADNTNVRCYLNGALIATVAKSLASLPASTSWDMGQSNVTIQDVCIYGGAISDADVAILAAVRNPKRRTNLVAFYPFFPGASRTTDYSGGARTLTTVGSPTDGTDAPVGWGAPMGRAFKALSATMPLVGASGPTGSASTTSLISVKQALVGNSDFQSFADAQISVGIAEAATAATLSSATAVMGVVYGISGSSTTASAASAVETVGVLPTGASPTGSSGDAAVKVAQALVGTAATTSDASATQGVVRGMTDAAVAASAASANMLMDANLGAGLSPTASAANAGLAVFVPEIGASTTASAANAPMSVAVALIGSAPTASAANATLSNTGFRGDDICASDANAFMSVTKPITATAPTGSAATGGLSVAVALAGTSATTSTTSTTEDIFYGMATTAVTGSAASATMKVAVALVGDSTTRSLANAYFRSAPLPQRTIRMPGTTRATVITFREGE